LLHWPAILAADAREQKVRRNDKRY